jgi:hypothetical protein
MIEKIKEMFRKTCMSMTIAINKKIETNNRMKIVTKIL